MPMKGHERRPVDQIAEVNFAGPPLFLSVYRSKKLTRPPRIDYNDARGKQRTWETAERRTRPKGGDIDGVGIVAILEKPTG